MLAFKIKQPIILTAKWVCAGKAENCYLGHARRGISEARSRNKGKTNFISWAVLNKSSLEKKEVLAVS